MRSAMALLLGCKGRKLKGWLCSWLRRKEVAKDGANVALLDQKESSEDAMAYGDDFEDIIEMDPIDTSIDVVQRGLSLFDRSNNTTVFNRDLKVNQTRLLDWDSLPEPARRYITLRASRIFQGRVVGSRELESLIARDEYIARANLLEFDSGSADRTIFDSYDVAARIGINRNYDLT